jgi:signal transduction histidine kinase
MAPLTRNYLEVSRAAAVFAAVVGLLVLVGGWGLGNEWLRTAGSSISMKTNGALGLAACGLSLVILLTTTGSARPFGRGLATLAGVIGAATLLEHISGWNLGIDEMLFTEAAGAVATTSPNRMGPNGSLSLLLESIALLSLYRESSRDIARAQVIAASACVLAIIPSIGYLYGAEPLYSLARVSGIAWHTALTLLVLGVGVLFARADMGPVATFLGEGAGGLLARNMAVPALALPVLLAYIYVLGERRGLYDTGMGTALFAIAIVITMSIALWRAAVALNRVDRDRTEALGREHAARVEAEHAGKLKDKFITALSHELRTPLNAILGWAQMLRDNAFTLDQRDRAVEVIARNGEHLGRLIEDLLDVSRLAGGHVTLDVVDVDMSDVAREVLEMFKPAATTKKVMLTSGVDGAPAIVRGDRKRLQQILWNLLSNAVKFTDSDGAVLLTVHRRDGHVEVQVVDNGQGIDPSFLPHVFDRFRQEDGSVTRSYGGLGLGLSIVHELTVLHGGQVSAASEGRGHGTTVTLTLPASADSRDRRPQSAQHE